MIYVIHGNKITFIVIVIVTAVPGVYNPEYIGIRTHARHATLCPGNRGISKHQNTGEFCQNCRAEYGIVTWRTIYSNTK